MADTRCANPEYQLDVDTMTIDYMVYHAIEARFKSLEQDLTTKNSKDKDLEATSERLIHIFDTLIRLFKHNHPRSRLSDGTNFNIKILEFLVLFGQLGHREVSSDRLNEERKLHTTYRRQWLDCWKSNPNGPGRDIKPYITTKAGAPENSSHITLNDIMVRFMDLSAEMANSMGRVNDHWYRLAAEFTLQCATERLQFLIDNKMLHASSDPSHFSAVVTWLSECFAWGIQPVTHISTSNPQETRKLKQHVQDQTFTNAIFQSGTASSTSVTDDQDDDTPVTTDLLPNETKEEEEDPSWTRIRTQFHSEVLHTIQPHHEIPADCTCARKLKGLRRKYPLNEFLLRVHSYVDGIWCLNNESISRKPVLVQIEEGGLDGLSPGEFGEFLERVGLKVKVGRGGKRSVRWLKVEE